MMRDLIEVSHSANGTSTVETWAGGQHTFAFLTDRGLDILIEALTEVRSRRKRP